MATIKCAVSGITFRCDHLPIHIKNTAGYFHPIFALNYKQLLGLYSKHCRGHLTATDSYLLFCALLHSTDSIIWKQPASRNPTSVQTIKLVENTITQLLTVIEKTNAITVPSFRQPKFIVDTDNSQLLQIPNWIKAWKQNIMDFQDGYKQAIKEARLEAIEKKLTYLIVSDKDTSSYAHIVADWADKVAEFPVSVADDWKKIIRSCFNSDKMFSTPLAELKEIKAYCEDNIEPGSVHSYTLYKILDEGINRNKNYLGFTLFPIDTTANDIEIAAIIENAPKKEPQRHEYSSLAEYLKAKLSYRTASKQTAITYDADMTEVPTTIISTTISTKESEDV